MTARDIIGAVSFDLNDQEPGYEFEHWTYEMLKQYLLEALIDLSQTFYRFFIRRYVVKAESGGVWQQACCDCDQVVRVVGETDETGQKILRTLIRITDNPDNEWPTDTEKICLKDPDEYQMVGYSISDTDGKYFRLVPPPTDGKDHYVAIECYTHIHSASDDDIIFWRFIPIVKEWMLARAYMVDGENNPAIFQLGKNHLEMYDMLVKRLLARSETEEEEKDFERTSQSGTSTAS